MLDRLEAGQFIEAGILKAMSDVEKVTVTCLDEISVQVVYNLYGNMKTTQCVVQQDVTFLEAADLPDLLVQIVDNLRFNIELAILKDRKLDIRDYESIKNNICYSVSKDIEHYKDVVHLPYLDMVVYFYILVDIESEYISRIEIIDETLKYWNVKIEDLLKVAVFNTEKLLPYEFKELDLEGQQKNRSIYSLSNNVGIHGACTILYPNVLSSIAEQLDSDLCIIMPCVHEVMITQKNTYKSQEDIETLGVVAKGIYAITDKMEKLSDRVYLYERANGKIRLLI